MEGMEGQGTMTEQEQITQRQMDEIFEEIDCFWLMWENESCEGEENLPSPTTTIRYMKNIPLLPPIDCRPLVARNQFVSQARLEDIMGLIPQHSSPSSASFLQTNSYGDQSTCLVEETIRNLSSTIHGKTINEILPSPQQADYIDLLQDGRRSSYGTALKLFAMAGERKDMNEPKGYSSPEFWRSFLGSRYSSTNIKLDEIQK